MSTGGKKGERPPQREGKQTSRANPAGAGPSRMVRMLATVALLWHVCVVFLMPLANSRSSDTVRSIAQSPFVRWYADPLYLNQGYGFFGPDPGHSMIVRYEVRGESGEVVADGEFPDRDRIWPRLRYHRYKMLADQLELPEYPPDRTKYVLERFARQLIREHDGQSASVTQVVHDLLPHADWLGDEERGIKGKSIDDPSTYRTLQTVRQTKRDVEEADAQLLAPAESEAPSQMPEAITPGGQL